MYKYTIGFVHCTETDEVLMLNRQKAPWMGRWNGVGGKLDAGESPLECIIREAYEETGLQLPQFVSRGVLKWQRDSVDLGGAYLFSANVSKEEVARYKTPLVYCHEGILDWKKHQWIVDDDNSGIVDNVRTMLRRLFEGREDDVYTAEYALKDLISVRLKERDSEEVELYK